MTEFQPDDRKDLEHLFDVRWRATLRAIKRWQEGDELPHCGHLRPLLNEILGHLEQDNPTLAARLKEQIRVTAPGGRENTWPDHADLVVWMLQHMEKLETALKNSIRHIDHMSAWIVAQNKGYSFESLGEDMPEIRAALDRRA